MTYAARIARRIPPDPAQLQVLVGTVLGRGRLVASAEGVHLVLALDARHAWLANWTYERLAPLVPPPVSSSARVVLRAEVHPVFEELAARLGPRGRLRPLVGPQALWVWALHERVARCEELGTVGCRCALLRPPRRRTLDWAS